MTKLSKFTIKANDFIDKIIKLNNLFQNVASHKILKIIKKLSHVDLFV